MKTLMISTIALLFAGTAIAAGGKMSWDTDADGMISEEEYTAAQERNKVFEAWDADSDGSLNADEFATGKWKMFDQNADNMWDETEAGMWMDAATRSGAEVSQ